MRLLLLYRTAIIIILYLTYQVIYKCYPLYGFSGDLDDTVSVIECKEDGYWNGTTNPICSNLPIYVSHMLSLY